jgi:hypothetical protein
MKVSWNRGVSTTKPFSTGGNRASQSEVGHEKNRILDAFFYTGGECIIIINFNYKEGWMDHIKLMIYGFIGMGALVAIIALLTQMLGIARG